MPSYRIHRLKDHLRAAFRSAPHVSGAAAVKPRDYEPGEMIDAVSPYAAFFAARDSLAALEIGDLLDPGDGSLRICKFVGFEEAHWVLPESAGGQVPESAARQLPESSAAPE
jgi:hypothetical protein